MRLASNYFVLFVLFCDSFCEVAFARDGNAWDEWWAYDGISGKNLFLYFGVWSGQRLRNKRRVRNASVALAY